MINIVLVNPKIPQNVGNIGRSCVAVGAKLHIVKPIPFLIDDKNLKRAGMDYWPHLDVTIWEDLNAFSQAHPMSDRHFFATTKTTKTYFAQPLLQGDFIYFGAEDEGLPSGLMGQRPEGMITIPMREQFRSLNLASSVAVILFDTVRQNFAQWEG